MKAKLINYHQSEAERFSKQEHRNARMEEYHRKQAENLNKWKHEDASCEMFDYMVKVNPELDLALWRNNIREHHRDLIKDLIKGKQPGRDKVKQVAMVGGVEYPKWFLFEIVANKRNGIDCDKFDYFARDCINLGVKSNFDHIRYIQNIRVLPVDGELQLCVRDKLAFDIYELFHTRWSLHHQVCQHKAVKVIEDMITDALVLLEDKYKFSEAIFNMKKYAKLTDSIFYDIIRQPVRDQGENSTVYEIIPSKDDDDNIRRAQIILNRIQMRHLYMFCGETRSSPKLKIDALKVAKEIALFSDGHVSPNDLFVHIVDIDYGKKEKNPVDDVMFYNKNVDSKFKISKNVVSSILPQKFSEQHVRVYGKKLKKDETHEKEKIEECFKKWCKKRGFPNSDDIPGEKKFPQLLVGILVGVVGVIAWALKK